MEPTINPIENFDFLVKYYLDSAEVRMYNPQQTSRTFMQMIANDFFINFYSGYSFNTLSELAKEYSVGTETLSYLELNCQAIFNVIYLNKFELVKKWNDNKDNKHFPANMALLRTVINAKNYFDNQELLAFFKEVGIREESQLWIEYIAGPEGKQAPSGNPSALCKLLLGQRNVESIHSFFSQTSETKHISPAVTPTPLKDVKNPLHVAPLSYVNDMCIAELNVSAKDANPSFPIIAINDKVSELANDPKIIDLIKRHRYLSFQKMEGYTDTEKLAALYFIKIDLMVKAIYGEDANNSILTNIKTYVQAQKETSQLDLSKLNAILCAICYHSNYEEEPETNQTMAFDKVIQSLGGDYTTFSNTVDNFVQREGLAISGYVKGKLSAEDCKMFVPILTKSGLFGCNTLLKLFFQKLIPFSCSIKEITGATISVHAGVKEGHVAVMEHDIEHAIRTFRVIKNPEWFNYLKNCYESILSSNEMDLPTKKMLLFYLFFITHEQGLRVEQINDFVEIISKRFTPLKPLFSQKELQVEYDESFMKILEEVSDPKLVRKEGQDREYAIASISQMHDLFDYHFRIKSISSQEDLKKF